MSDNKQTDDPNHYGLEPPALGAEMRISRDPRATAVPRYSLLLAFVTLGACTDNPAPVASTATPLPDLQTHGRAVEEATGGNVVFVEAVQTTTSPYAFVLRFETSDEALMSRPVAEPGDAGYVINSGRRNLWSRRFCTAELRSIMSRHRIVMVTGNLTDLMGEIQSVSACLTTSDPAALGE